VFAIEEPAPYKERLQRRDSMQNRWNRIGSLAFSGLLTVALFPTASSKLQAQRPTRSSSGVEKSLAGVRILQSYKSVLDRFGAPTRIFPAGDILNYEYARDAKGILTGGVIGYGDSTPAGGATLARTGGAPAGGGGMSGAGGMMGMMTGRGMAGMSGGAPGAGGPPSNIMAAMGAMSGGGMSGMSGMRGGNPMAPGGGGMPGFSGRRGGDDEGGAPAMPGAMTGGAGGNAAKGSTFGDAGGFIWSYLDPKAEKVTTFQFNKDGRVEVIAELGRFRSSVTSKGLSIGSALQDVYTAYGWPDSTKIDGEHTVLVYLQKHHLEVALVNNRVVGLIVTLRESNYVPLSGGASNTGAAGGGMARMTGMGGGMSGAMMGGMPRMSGGAPSIGGRMMPGRGAIGGGGGGKFGGAKGE
jgi:hypothetical protein